MTVQTKFLDLQSRTVLAIDRLNLGLSSGLGLVHDVSLSIQPGEIVSVVGESDSGKTLTGRSVVNLMPPGIQRVSGDVVVAGRKIFDLSPAEMRQLRGTEIGFIFQDPMTSLNPSMTVGRQLDETLRIHGRGNAAERRNAVLEILAQVGIVDPERAFTSWPHQFSGGMRQRIMIASAMLLKPRLIIADEPTTALDAIVQRGVMELLVDLAKDQGSAVMLISHDLPMVAHYCSRIYVMKSGRVVEEGLTGMLLDEPKDPYTRTLLASIPQRGQREQVDHPALLDVSGLEVTYSAGTTLFGRKMQRIAVKHADIRVGRGEVVAVVGQSGSGKTTLGKAIAGLIPTSSGTIRFDGIDISAGQKMAPEQRRHCQFVFQDPHSSLDPRMTVRQLLRQPIRRDPLSEEERDKRVQEILDDVGLGSAYADRYPHQLSGGQKQRVAIARALIGRPKFVIADEAVSALDVTVRAQILKLFAELQKKHKFSCLFVSHDLGAVEEVADRVVVMRDGSIVEEGAVADIFDRPQSSYTRQLLSALPVLTRTDTGMKLSWRAMTN